MVLLFVFNQKHIAKKGGKNGLKCFYKMFLEPVQCLQSTYINLWTSDLFRYTLLLFIQASHAPMFEYLEWVRWLLLGFKQFQALQVIIANKSWTLIHFVHWKSGDNLFICQKHLTKSDRYFTCTDFHHNRINKQRLH